MSAKPNNAELNDLADRAEELSIDLHRMAERVRKNLGYDEDMTSPSGVAKKFAGIARSASDLAHILLVVMSNEEDRRALRAKLLSEEAP